MQYFDEMSKLIWKVPLASCGWIYFHSNSWNLIRLWPVRIKVTNIRLEINCRSIFSKWKNKENQIRISYLNQIDESKTGISNFQTQRRYYLLWLWTTWKACYSLKWSWCSNMGLQLQTENIRGSFSTVANISSYIQVGKYCSLELNI